ncbi:uncharacterized protein LOC132536420 [Erinaceus europaeus]|uniref:Uncharacterized protein LOC132536420 n=1 Tax=Erinaceus europaeus TaxID=9365 RepID=A0ABM3WUJ2_ERIEU|nr:uncharacterized protein LOC132536420 [Erinaceus europaeus]
MLARVPVGREPGGRDPPPLLSSGGKVGSTEAQSGADSARHRPPPGSRKPGSRREGGGGGGERREAPEEAARPAGGGGGGLGATGAGCVPSLKTRRPRTAARSPPGLGRAAALGSQAELAEPRSRRVALSLQPPPATPAAQPRSVPGSALRRCSPPWKQWRAAERRRRPRPLPRLPPPPPPRRVNPFAVPAAPRLLTPRGSHPPPSPGLLEVMLLPYHSRRKREVPSTSSLSKGFIYKGMLSIDLGYKTTPTKCFVFCF